MAHRTAAAANPAISSPKPQCLVRVFMICLLHILTVTKWPKAGLCDIRASWRSVVSRPKFPGFRVVANRVNRRSLCRFSTGYLWQSLLADAPRPRSNLPS